MGKKRKKILYLITKSNWGGAQKYVFDLATGISKDRFDTIVALGGEGELKKRLDMIGVRTISINELERNINPIKDILVFKKIIRMLKAEKPDVIHINSSKIGGLGSFAGRLAKVPLIVFTAHAWAWNEDRPFWQKIIIKELQWLTILFSHKTIVVSDALMKQAYSFFFAKKKIEMIYTGIHKANFLERIKARDFLKNKAPKLCKEKIWIGTVSELHKNKGHVYIIEAVKKLKDRGILNRYDFQCVFVGDGEERASIEKKISELGLNETIILVGQTSDAARFLLAFDAFLLASNTEALGYVLMESGLAHLPTIATKVGGIPEIIEDMRSGILVHRKNPGEIANALAYTLENRDKIEKFADALYKKVTSVFTIDKMINKTEKVYLSMDQN